MLVNGCRLAELVEREQARSESARGVITDAARSQRWSATVSAVGRSMLAITQTSTGPVVESRSSIG